MQTMEAEAATRPTGQEVGRRGQEIYDREIRSVVEPEHIGRFVVIDVETGEYILTDDRTQAALSIRARKPNAQLFGVKIGYVAVAAIGTRLKRAS